jgi:hypothetical protein
MIAKPIAAARPAYSLAESRVSVGVVSFFRLISPLYFRFLGFRRAVVRHPERLVGAFRDFFDGKTRLIIAFRHPYGDEAQLMAYVIGKGVAREARRLGVSLPRAPHAHFVHGYEVPLWGGGFERWLLPRVGAVPVYHAKFDSASVSRIRSLMVDGRFPLALAPEGQVSYTSEGLPRIESGAARIAVWCAEDLRRAKRSERVVILPVSIHHRWDGRSGGELDDLIARIERECGIGRVEGASRHERLSSIADSILASMENFYARFYSSGFGGTTGAEASAVAGNPTRADRLSLVIESALFEAERVLGVEHDGDTIRRVYKVRQAGWDRIFRSDIPDPELLSPLERALADRVAGEAWYASRHMELVDLAYYLDFERLKPEDPLELYIETAQNYFDLVSRLMGGNISNRIGIGGKTATVVAGNAIGVADFASGPGGNYKSAAVGITEKLRLAYAECIEEIRKEREDGR